jgi:cell volume regulation protein A
VEGCSTPGATVTWGSPRSSWSRSTAAPPFSVRPWKDGFGDPGAPESIGGTPVLRSVRMRRGEPGALVQLEDGRYAVTGEGVVAVGGARQLFRYCRERIRRAEDEQSRAWWQEVAGVLSQRVVR